MAGRGSKKKSNAAGKQKGAANSSTDDLSVEARLLNELVEQAISGGVHSAARFLHDFPPESLMHHLKDAEALRARILHECVGMPLRTAGRLDSDVAAQALEAALDVGDTRPADVVNALPADDRARHLPTANLWAFVDADSWWTRKTDETEAFIQYLLTRARHHELLDIDAWIGDRGVSMLGEKAPRETLSKLLVRACELGTEDKPFTTADIRAIVTANDFIEMLGAAELHDALVTPMAEACGYLSNSATETELSGGVLIAPKAPVFEEDLRWSTPPAKASRAPKDESAAS